MYKADECSTSSDVLQRFWSQYYRCTGEISSLDKGLQNHHSRINVSRFNSRTRRKKFGRLIYSLIDHEVHHQVHPSLFQLGD